MPKGGNHRRFKREIFLLTGSGHKGSTKKPHPVKAEVQAQEELQFQAHQEAIKVNLPSICLKSRHELNVSSKYGISQFAQNLEIPFVSGLILQKDTLEFVPQIKYCPHKINYNKADYK